MAAPLFTDDEVNALMTCEKYLSSEAVAKKFRECDHGCQKRRLQLDVPTELPGMAKLVLDIEESVVECREEVTISLMAQIGNRGSSMLCHYDIQLNAHENPLWADGKWFKPYDPHRHVYSPRSVLHGDLTGLSVAEEITIRNLKTFARVHEALFHIFCEDVNLIVDKDYQLGLFQK